ncbi:gastrin/cholecystokinin-like peptide [Engraulis encrasicolus]|uniref:gastrin/cholecystokinin-like peptide n=1 Tax=Engraulis encrasicolus TaxID=184585 RepID=UPI002FCF614A
MALHHIAVMVLVALLAASCLASPLSQADGATGKGAHVAEIRAKRDIARKALARRENSVQTLDNTRVERMLPLPDDQREYMNRQIMQALAEIISQNECFSDRDYKGWVDFGKRSVE